METASLLTPEQLDYVLAHTPGLAEPPGVVANLADPYSKGYLLTLTTAITLTVTTLFVLIRTTTRKFISKNGLGWDDYVSVLAWILFVIYTSYSQGLVSHGAYTHQWNVSAKNTMKFAEMASIIQALYAPVMFFIKLAILLQFLSIFAPGGAGRIKTHYLCHFMIWFNLLFYTAGMFAAIFVCTPRAKFWNPTLPGHCININAFIILSASINFVSDSALLLLPIICVWKLQMSLNKKIGVSALFATGTFACVCSLMRILSGARAAGDPDVTWAVIDEGLWAIGEFASGIVCGCMPTLPQFFRHFVPKIRTALSSGGKGGPKRLSASSAEGSDRLGEAIGTPLGGSQYADGESDVDFGGRAEGLNSCGDEESAKSCNEDKGTKALEMNGRVMG